MMVLNFFNNLLETINNWFKELINFDEIIKTFYDNVIAPIPEIIKILGSAFLVFILILGVLSFIKKFIKISIFIGIIILIVVVFVIIL